MIQSSKLQELLFDTNKFIYGAELVTSRGLLLDEQGKKNLELAQQLCNLSEIDFIDFTDNPGGHPMLLPESMGTEILYRGKNVMINLTCKDINRNGLESRAWKLASAGFDNILCMTGDYPVGGYYGLAKPVFDMDSIGLISLLKDMNDGLPIMKNHQIYRLKKTNFNIGCVLTPYKYNENELLPQYFKFEKAIRAGANYVIIQIGFDSRKSHELLCYLRYHNIQIPVIANIYVLTGRIAKIFHQKEIPGVLVTDNLLHLAEKYSKGADKGKSFFYELAAKQIAIARGLGYAGAYLGGIHKIEDYNNIFDRVKKFGANDWMEFAKEIQYFPPNGFYYFEFNPDTRLNIPDKLNSAYLKSISPKGRKILRNKSCISYRFSLLTHDLIFDLQSRGYQQAKRFYSRLEKNHPILDKYLYKLEKIVKALMFDCRDCGDCSLPDIAYLCPESQCVKNQRNGPCGGTREGYCELNNGKKCIWSIAYDRLKPYEKERDFIQTPVIIKNNALQGTSAWKNTFLARDHFHK